MSIGNADKYCSHNSLSLILHVFSNNWLTYLNWNDFMGNINSGQLTCSNLDKLGVDR